MTASFTNGSFYKGSLVVGCDGPRSKVRELLLGKQRADITPMEIIHSNVAIVYGDAEKARFVRSAHPVFSMMVHPEMLVFIASTSTSLSAPRPSLSPAELQSCRAA